MRIECFPDDSIPGTTGNHVQRTPADVCRVSGRKAGAQENSGSLNMNYSHYTGGRPAVAGRLVPPHIPKRAT